MKIVYGLGVEGKEGRDRPCNRRLMELQGAKVKCRDVEHRSKLVNSVNVAINVLVEHSYLDLGRLL